MADGLALTPAPREWQRLDGPGARLGPGSRIELAARHALARAARARLEDALCEGGGRDGVSLRVDAELPLGREGFEIECAGGAVRVAASDAHGLLYGAGALAQLAAQSPGGLPALRIRDRPDLAVRGYMLDVSRDRVPTLEALFERVELLARLRINQLQLYTEHAFAYAGHDPVWRDASPLTPDEVRALDAHCAERGIELVPNQNSFGHMERWLRHPRYAHLAERPAGGSGGRPPSCLAPTRDSVEFVRALYAQLLPCFASRQVNIGCDETFELGRGRSRARCEAQGHGRVYLDFLLELIGGLRARGYGVQFWGDILWQHPELVPELPREGVVALAWGYEAPLDPAALPERVREALESRGATLERLRGFEALARPYAASGIPFYLCPGTSSWNSLVGRLPNALANLRDAAEAGRACRADGVLITDWGDNGHLQPPVVSLPPLVYGAAVAWGVDANRDLDLAAALARALPGERHVLVSELLRLGGLYRELDLFTLNASPLALALLAPLERPLSLLGECPPERLQLAGAALDEAVASLDGPSLAERELRQAAALARHGAWRLDRRLHGGGPPAARLRADLPTCWSGSGRSASCGSPAAAAGDSPTASLGCNVPWTTTAPGLDMQP